MHYPSQKSSTGLAPDYVQRARVDNSRQPEGARLLDRELQAQAQDFTSVSHIPSGKQPEIKCGSTFCQGTGPVDVKAVSTFCRRFSMLLPITITEHPGLRLVPVATMELTWALRAPAAQGPSDDQRTATSIDQAIDPALGCGPKKKPQTKQCGVAINDHRHDKVNRHQVSHPLQLAPRALSLSHNWTICDNTVAERDFPPLWLPRITSSHQRCS